MFLVNCKQIALRMWKYRVTLFIERIAYYLIWSRGRGKSVTAGFVGT